MGENDHGLDKEYEECQRQLNRRATCFLDKILMQGGEMNECCKRYVGRCLRIEFRDPCRYDIECGPSIHFGRRDMRFCPECGSHLVSGDRDAKWTDAEIEKMFERRAKPEPVYCKACRHFEHDRIARTWACNYPENTMSDWYAEDGCALRGPEDINSNNDCKWYEEKQEGKCTSVVRGTLTEG
jgi:hypothetical protein